VSCDFKQLATERQWLRGQLAGSLLAPVANRHPSPASVKIAERVEKILMRPELARFLSVLGRHNSDRFNRESRNVSPFLLGPQLFHIIRSVQARRTFLENMPALDRPSAEVRAHFKNVSAKAKALARLLRKGLQPTVQLAPHNSVGEAAPLFQVFPIFQSYTDNTMTMPLDRLLEDATTSFDLVAHNIGRAKKHRRPASNADATEQRDLRSRAVSVLLRTFRKWFARPYLVEVATIAQILSGIETDKEYVKKVDQRQRAQRDGDISP
jgi:hypothetical protein